MPLKTTPLKAHHKKQGAKMVDFGGWEMPVQYTSVIDEHNTTRTAAGLFDICHMGEVRVQGKNAFSFLQYLVTGNLGKLIRNKAMYTFFCNEMGGVVDEAIIYMHNTEDFFLVFNAGPTEKDVAWLQAHASRDVTITDISPITGKLDIQGPKAEKILQSLTPLDLWNLPRFHFINTTLAEKPIMLSRTGYTGEDGFEIYSDIKHAVAIWEHLMDTGESFGIKPIGLGARDTLRLESCYCLYGHEMSEDTGPIPAGLGWAVDLKKDAFIGKKALAQQKSDGPAFVLVGFEMKQRAIPRGGYIVEARGKPIGKVTSGTFSPTLKKPIGLAYIQPEYVGINREVDIIIRNKPYKAIQVKKPFYKFNGKAS